MNFRFSLVLFLMILYILPFTANAEPDADLPIIGSWVLDKVYELGSTKNPIELDPESAQSVYAEKINIYTFHKDGSASMTINAADGSLTFSEGLSWEQVGDVWRFHDRDGIDTDYIYSYEDHTLNRYWRAIQTDSAYQDLHFVFKRVPVGSWKMKQVFSNVPGEEPLLFDPETSQSLYAEEDNDYILFADMTVCVKLNDGVEISGYWVQTEKGVCLSFDEWDNMDMIYDPETEVLHRYWDDEELDSTYAHLDFVYMRD